MSFLRYCVAIIFVIGVGAAIYAWFPWGAKQEGGAPQPLENLLIPGWHEAKDESGAYSFQYPEGFETTFVAVVDWPPVLRVEDGAFSCTEAGDSASPPGGITEEITTATNAYCVTRESEGAAGSIYTMYAYAFPFDGKTAFLTFSLREPQCANYDEPKQSACAAEEEAFSPDATIDRIAGTLVKR